MWTKRIVVVGGFVTVGVLAVFNWEIWFFCAAEFGQTVFTEIDRQAHSAQRGSGSGVRRPSSAVFISRSRRSSSSSPPAARACLSAQVFNRHRAADRGIAPRAGGGGLRELQRELVAHLHPPQQTRLADYDRARANRVVFFFENFHALDFVGRGARAMLAASRARLQHLLGKTVAAEFELPPPSRGGTPAGDGVAP
jgi:hypothetical protein